MFVSSRLRKGTCLDVRKYIKRRVSSFPSSSLTARELHVMCRANIITRIHPLLTYVWYIRAGREVAPFILDELDYFLPIDSIRLSTGISAIYNDIYIFVILDNF